MGGLWRHLLNNAMLKAIMLNNVVRLVLLDCSDVDSFFCLFSGSSGLSTTFLLTPVGDAKDPDDDVTGKGSLKSASFSFLRKSHIDISFLEEDNLDLPSGPNTSVS
jgi:hypothetical protein